MRNFYRTAVSLALGLFAASAFAQDFDAIVEDCNGCHGDDGVSQWTDMPTIAGLPEFVHADALFVYLDEARPCEKSEYRQGDTSRPAKTMCEVVAELDEGTLEDLAAYYFELPFVPAKQDFDAALAAAGEAVHMDKCDKCHSDAGTNPDDEASILGGQWMGYMERTIAEFRNGDREAPKAKKEKMDELTDDDAKALLHFYASQQ
jgi:sulfide dehydrogenase cytochrome subunit